MANKRPLLYLIAALGLAAVIFLVERPDSSRVKSASEVDFVPDYDTANVVSFDVEQLLDGAKLKRDGENWLVTDLPTEARKELLEKEGKESPPEKWHMADRSRVMGALGIFGNLGEGALVSENPEKRSHYQVDVTGVHTKAFDAKGNTVFDVVIGKNGPDFASAYIRRADEDRVYLVRHAIVGQFSPRANDWRDRKLWSLNPATIKEVSVKFQKGSWRMKKSDAGEWELLEPKDTKFDSKKAHEAVGKLSNVSAKGFADDVDLESAGLDKPTATVTIKHGDDKEVSLNVGKQAGERNKGHFHVEIGGSDEYYLVSPEVIDSLPFEPPH